MTPQVLITQRAKRDIRQIVTALVAWVFCSLGSRWFLDC